MGLGISPQAWGTVSTGLQVGGAATAAIGAYAQSSAIKAQASISETNARLSELGAEAALLQGQHEEEVSRLSTAELKSTQKVAITGNGLDLNSGSANRILTSTDLLGSVDADTIHANAVRAAFGYKAQAVSSRIAGISQGATSPLVAATSTLIGGGATVAKSWYTLNKGLTVTPPPSNTEPNYGYGNSGP